MAELRVTDPMLAARIEALLSDADVIITDDLPADLPEEPVIILADGPDVHEALRAGIRGVLSPGASTAQLRAAIEAVARGLIVLAPEAAEALLEPAAAEPETALTPRELEVLALLAEGASNKTIARRLGISFHTAKFHVAAILSKLGARSRADAVAQGLRFGLLLL